MVETFAPSRKFVVSRGHIKSSFGYLSLVNAKAPEIEKVHVRVNVDLVEIFVLVVVSDMLVLGGSAHEYECKWGKGIRQEDLIAEEKGRDEAVYAVEVDNSTGAGVGESSKRIVSEAGLDFADGWDNCFDGAEGGPVVEDDQGCVWAHANEASHFVGWAKECSAKVVRGGKDCLALPLRVMSIGTL